MFIFGKASASRSPIFIAEISGNHDGSIDKAMELISVAHQSGASAVKLQTYTADTITLKSESPDFVINDSSSPWHNRSLYELYSIGSTPWAWHKQLFDYANYLGIEILSTPFDLSSVDLLESLGCSAYKIASFEINHIPLLQAVASTGKPVILSCGLASKVDISLALDTLISHKCPSICLLKCTSEYPAPYDKANLLSMVSMREEFGTYVGVSDHTLDVTVPIVATSLGASVIEKHITLSRSDGGIDSSFSLEPDELRQTIESIQRAASTLGKANYYPATDDSPANMKYRRSIFISANVACGELFSSQNIKVVRPATGAHPKFYDQLIGTPAKIDLPAGTPLSIANHTCL